VRPRPEASPPVKLAVQPEMPRQTWTICSSSALVSSARPLQPSMEAHPPGGDRRRVAPADHRRSCQPLL